MTRDSGELEPRRKEKEDLVRSSIKFKTQISKFKEDWGCVFEPRMKADERGFSLVSGFWFLVSGFWFLVSGFWDLRFGI